jgi:AcrR family transcriptional regulator
VSEARAAEHDDIRGRLVAAAAEVFSEKGYDGARVQEIARRAGLTTGAIYGRFTGKAELLHAAIEAHSHSEFEELFASHAFDGRITDILRTVGSHLVTREATTEQALLLEAFVAARRDPEVKRLVSDLVRTRSQRLARLVEEAKATGLVSRELDDLAVVCFAHSLGLGFLLFDAVDYPLPAAEPWSALIGRMVAALGDE